LIVTTTSEISSASPSDLATWIGRCVTDLDDLTRLQIYIVCYAFFAMLMALWILPALIAALTPLRYGGILRTLRTPLVTAFATGSSLIVLPLLIDQCKQLLADSKQLGLEESDDSEQADSLVKVLIPTAYPFLSPTAILMLIFLLFGGWYTGSAVETSNYPKIFLAGIPSLFAGPFIAMPFLLDLLKLPQDLFPIFVSMDVIIVRFGTLLSAMHYSTIALIGTFFLLSKQRVQWRALVKLVAVSVVLIAVFLLATRGFYTYVVTPTYTKANVMRGLQLREAAQPAVVHDTAKVSGSDSPEKLAMLADIIQRSLLRVCFQPNEYPSAFYTSATPPELVGFDIEMAHMLARPYQLPIEFFPAADESEAAGLLNAGTCDIYTRTLPITAGRTAKFNLTLPIYTSSVGIIVKDYRRREFTSWDTLRTYGSKLRIGADSAKESLFAARNLLPDAQITPIGDMDEQAKILESKSGGIDAIMDMSEEGAAWSVIYPMYSVVVPKPTVFIPVGYAVAKGNDELLTAINAGLMLVQANGTIDKNYEYWMLGGAATSERPPRWSVIKDVLKWVD
jgi:ABC-type amino acid transport substrate-binding protein